MVNAMGRGFFFRCESRDSRPTSSGMTDIPACRPLTLLYRLKSVLYNG